MAEGDRTAKRSRIFISYRREDTERAVGRLADEPLARSTTPALPAITQESAASRVLY